ncbi:unnamed protein product [Porites lobata]|uniref:Uncharacterized protein n=1 Tax=Porites lobata TaxID=104759 RepID=A0ABN8RKC1_9CNID|nr:unnamed protein product [Porites lobata]
MCTEQEVRVQLLLAFFFVAALSYQEVEVLSIKTGICNFTITTPGLFACEKVSFENTFNGGQDVKVFVSKSHTTNSYSGGNGAAIWVESVDNKEFTVCVLEYGDGSSRTAKVNWMALQSVPVGAQLDTISLDSWTTGEKCKRIAFEKRFSIPPSIYVTARHQILKRPQDALALWVEDVRRDSFKVCLRETKIYDGLHKNIKVDWIAFVKLMTLNSTLIHGLVTTKNNSPLKLNKQQSKALCQIIKFTDAFYAPPIVMVSPRLSYHNNNSRFSASGTCNAVTVWIQHTFTNETEVCMRRYSNNANYKDIVQLDYLVIGDLDPCIDVTCYYYSFCKAFGPHDARCVCVDSCPSYKEPVCSSNGTTYDNRCLFEREVCLHRLNLTVQHPGSCEGFPFQRGRRHMPHIPSLGYSHCHAIHFKPFVFYPDKPIQVQITVNHMDTSDKSYVHDAAVSWVENVNNDGFTACVMAAGYNERKSYANVTVDWMAYQGAPVGGVTGEVRMSQWWTGTTCATVRFPTGKFSVIPSVFVTAKHYNPGLKRDAASIWIEDVTQSSCKVCLRELQNYAGSHQDVVVNWLAFSYLDEPPFSEHNSIYFSNDKPPAQSHYNAFCKDATFAKVHNSTPHVFVSANHSTKNGSQSPIHNSIAEWVEYINKTGFRACVKELYEAKYDPLSVTYTVLSDICPSGWDYFNGYCYLSSSVCAPWVTAVSNCSAMNSYLVTVHNQEENVFIQHRDNGERSWIGLNDRSVEGSFVWTSKEITSFRFWAPQQPNNWKNEDCVHTLGANDGYTWNDVSCDNCYNYTCVQEIDDCTTNYHRCNVNAACQNTVGSYKCTCKAGYSGNGRKCVEIDECTSKTHNCDRNGLCKNTEGTFTCTCKPGYKGDEKKCKASRGLVSYDPAQSCKEIKDLGISNGDGKYWIDPGRTKRPFKAYCDMTTDGGGWLLVSNVVSHGSSTTQLPVKTSYRGISSKEMVLTKSAMKELRKHLHFTQMRFHCKKRGGRTFHITTAANSKGEAVAKYLSGETAVIPASCGSFVIMSNDNSRLARLCQHWGKENGYYKVGKWGHERDQDRLSFHTAFVWDYPRQGVGNYFWNLEPGGRWECDDFNVGVSPGDFWKIFVR